MELKITMKAARINAGLTVKEAAAGLGVTPQTICNWEASRTIPGYDKAQAMSELYKFPLDNIFIPQKSEKIG